MNQIIPFYIRSTADWRLHRQYYKQYGTVPYYGRYVKETRWRGRQDPFEILPLCSRVRTRIARLLMERHAFGSKQLPLP